MTLCSKFEPGKKKSILILRTTLEHLAKPRDEKELNRNRVLYRIDIKEDFLQSEEEEKQMGKGNPQKSGPGGDLHTAARSGDLIAVQSILISNPLTVNSRDKHSRTPYPHSS
jgi:hypothetical protein